MYDPIIFSGDSCLFIKCIKYVWCRMKQLYAAGKDSFAVIGSNQGNLKTAVCLNMLVLSLNMVMAQSASPGVFTPSTPPHPPIARSHPTPVVVRLAAALVQTYIMYRE